MIRGRVPLQFETTIDYLSPPQPKSRYFWVLTRMYEQVMVAVPTVDYKNPCSK